jgi:UDP-N-acetylmuramate dehydrogenase
MTLNFSEAHVLKPLRGEVWYRERLAGYTSWRVGGPADRLYLPADRDDLLAFLKTLPEHEPLFWLGLGSNLLVRDGGIRGSVISTRNRLKLMRRIDIDHVFVEVGVPCAHVARYCTERNMSGAEFLAGIPGTMGGALAMNAGAFGGETWSLVEKVLTTDRFGAMQERGAGDYSADYRSVKGGEGEWFLGAWLKLTLGDAEAGRERIRGLLARRAATQPTQQPSCGSVFRNPPGDYAARLIEASGLKGHSLGGACVSEKHANFIVNLGNATAWEIERLIAHVREQVKLKQGVELTPEVRIVGDFLEESK